MDPFLDTIPVDVEEAGSGLSLMVLGPRRCNSYPVPDSGEVTLGRGKGSDLVLLERSISRGHARRVLGLDLTIEDLGSRNGTKVRGKRLVPHQPERIGVGEIFELGKQRVALQRRWGAPVAAAGELEALRSHLDALCARAGTQGKFSLGRLRAAARGAADLEELVASAARPGDHVARLGADEYAILLHGCSAAEARAVGEEMTSFLSGRAVDAWLGIATFPDDGIQAASLMERACGRLVERDAALGLPPHVIVRDPRMLQLYRDVERVARLSDLDLLLCGESGAGKDMLAEHFHRCSSRAAGPLLRRNCAAIPESLVESDLFGHERGAFSGATATRVGLFEDARGGTVFLDEIGELPLHMQSKLLLALERREIVRLGSNRALAIDVRFVFATNRNLKEEVARKRFRADLYYRINGYTAVVPPLRERRREIGALADAFCAKAARKRAASVTLAPETVALLEAYDWPGNVRELQRAIERAVAFCTGPELLPEHLREPFCGGREAGQHLEPDVEQRADLETQLAIYERTLILRALEESRWTKSAAARKLGIARNTLDRKLDEYGLVPPSRRVAVP